jgi:hypothetical protein
MTDPIQPPPEFPKGHRPQVFSEPAIDQLYDGYVILGTELAVAFDRIDTLERLLQERLGVTLAEIDGYKPNEAVDAATSPSRRVGTAPAASIP